MAEMKGRDVMDDDAYDEEDEDTQKDKYLTFHLGAEDYGIEIVYVIEIIGIQRITEVPDMPSFIRGVINLRGQVIPVMDVRARFRMEPRAYDDRTCVVVISVRDTALGLIVDTVQEVRDIPEDHVSAPPQVGQGASSRYIKGMGRVGEQVKILLDVERLLFEEEFDQLKTHAG